MSSDDEATGRSRGGYSTKIPVYFELSGGQAHGINMLNHAL